MKSGNWNSGRRVRTGAATSSIAVITMLSACGNPSPSGDGELEEVLFGMSTPNMASNWVALPVAQEMGYFEEEGIQVEGHMLKTSGEVLQAMGAERVEIGAPTPEAALPAMDQGQDVTMVYEWTRRPVAAFAVLEGSPITAIEDLEGKRIGVQSRSAGPALLSDASLVQAGLDAESDVTYVEVSVGAAALDALQRERVDALMLYDTQYAGMEMLGADLRLMRAEGVDNLFATTFVVNDGFLEAQPDAVAGFGRAWTKASVWALANPEAAIRIMWEHYPESKAGSGSEEEQMEMALAIFNARMEAVNVDDPTENDLWGRYDEAAVEDWISFALENELIEKQLAPEDVYTNEFADTYNDFDAQAVIADAESAG